MKGIVNKGIQEFVESQFGPQAWAPIRDAAGCDEPFFAVSNDYPDEMTLALVAAVAAHAGLGEDEAMVAYGRWLIPNTLKETYGTYFALAGAAPRQFLANMNRIHEHVTRSLPNARPPRFEYRDRPDGSLAITYLSNRDLCPVLHGLILGVGDLFGQELSVRETSCARRGDPACTMEVTLP